MKPQRIMNTMRRQGEWGFLKTNKIAIIGVMTAVSLVIFILEAQIPPIVPIPGVKLGLANIITLIAVYIIGRKEAFTILMLRIVIGSIYSGNVQAFIYSIAGGAACFLVTASVSYFIKADGIWIVSILGALAHIAGQLAAAFMITGMAQVVYYAPVLVISAIVTGAFTGAAAQGAYKKLEKIKGRKQR